MKKFNKLICLVLTLALICGMGAFNGIFTDTANAAASFELIHGSTLSIDTATGTLRNLIPGLSISTVKGNFKTDVTVYDANGKAVDDTGVIGTGFKIKASDGSTLTAVVFGDISGDGILSSPDFIALKSHLKGVVTITGTYFYAADVTGDNMVSTTDTVAVKGSFGNGADIFTSFYGKQYIIEKITPKYPTAADAMAGTNSTGIAAVGTYYVHKSYPAGLDGMYYLTTSSSSTGTGFWINPALFDTTTDSSVEDSSEEDSSEDDSSEVVTGTPYVIVTEINKYSTSNDAVDQENPSGTLAAGTYYIYNKYPDGYNGMLNLTTDPTGESAGYWINPAENTVATASTYVVIKTINKYGSAADALAQTNPTGTVAAGTYYIYSKYPTGYNGMYNLTTDTTGAAAGFWINPTENVNATASAYVLSQDMPKYSSSTDASNQTNSTGTASAGTYYIYNNYPDGLNGMYNLTTDPTGATAGFWINPADANQSVDGTITLVRPVNKYGYASDAVNQANITGVATAGTYYIYNNYPNGLNGMYNITTDSTGATAGFWINPKENTSGKLNYDVTKAVWLSQFDMAKVYVSGSSQNSESAFRYRVKKTMQEIKNCGYNTIMVQVRPNGDAFYNSQYFPWSKYVVGSYGKTASYDPFPIIIEEAYAQALSVHAWVNPMRLMSTSEITSVPSTSIIGQWYNDTSKCGTYIVAVDGTYYLNPGYADVRNLIINGVTEICQNYDVDGIHFDDYFYPDGVTNSFDQAAFSASGQSSRATWRKLCVNAFVKGTYNAVKAIDSGIVFGISPAGSISNNTNYLYADVKTWCSTIGYVDYIAPQIYWGFEHTYSPFDEVLAEWEALMTNTSIKLVPAVTLDKAGGNIAAADGTEWTNNKDVIKRQLELINTCKNFGGVMVFSLADFYNPATNAYVSALSSERANYEPVLKAMHK